jgi:hypothetical protein
MCGDVTLVITTGRECYLLDQNANFVTTISSDTSQMSACARATVIAFTRVCAGIGQFFGLFQPTAAQALVDGGYLQQVVQPDLSTGVVCEQWQLSSTPSGNDTAANTTGTASSTNSSSVVQLVLLGGCPSGTLWLSAVQQSAVDGSMQGVASALAGVNSSVLAASLATQVVEARECACMCAL